MVHVSLLNILQVYIFLVTNQFRVRPFPRWGRRLYCVLVVSTVYRGAIITTSWLYWTPVRLRAFSAVLLLDMLLLVETIRSHTFKNFQLFHKIALFRFPLHIGTSAALFSYPSIHSDLHVLLLVSVLLEVENHI